MITSMAFAVSTTSVSASHERTASIDDDSVKGDTAMIRVITIANDGPDAIDTVWIIVPESWGAEAVKQVPVDNIVSTASGNEVVLPAGTVVQLLGNVTVTLAENTDVIVVKGGWIYVDEVEENTRLNENAMVEVRQPTTTTGVGIPDGENIGVTGEISVDLTTDNQLRLLADTMVLTRGDNIVELPENTMLELFKANDDDIALDENVKTTLNVTVTLNNNKVRMVTDKPSNLKGFDIPTGENITLTGDNEVVIPADTVVQLVGTASIQIPENTDVIRENGKQLDVTGAVMENLPTKWTQDNKISTLPPGTCVEWVGDENNQIASGESLDFPFAFTSPGSGDYTIYVRTVDTKGAVKQTEIALTTDNTLPTVEEIAVSPEWAKANTAVTITVTASEPLARLDNVLVAENLAPENSAATFVSVSADKKVWTWTYTTTDNENRDGTANIYVLAADFEDLVGNEGEGGAENTFTVDRIAPPMPVLSEISGFPEDNIAIPDMPGIQTNTAVWFIENEAMDNFLGSLVHLEGGTVKIRVGTTVHTLTPTVSGYYSKSITLTEGTQEVGIWYIDRAGNVGEENAENVTLDTKAPSIAWGTIAGEALTDGVQINDNTPKITLTISDAGLGVDNIPFNADENEGYRVQLWNANKVSIDNLVNALAHDNNVLDFENTIPELGDNTYYIYAVAGDNLQMENKLVKFVIDTAAPSAPKVDAAYLIDSTVDAPLVVKRASRTIAGTAEAGADITVYGTVDTTEKVLDTVTAGSDDKWTATFTLTAGSNTKIEVSATDEAGNEGSRELYGWMLADASAPTVTLDEVPDTTDKTSITISGTVTKDAWEDWSEITLTVQVGVGKVEVPCVGGSYEYSVALSEGPNTIVVQATDDIGNPSTAATDVVERTVTPWSIYAIILVIVALILAAVAIFRKR